MSKPFDPTGLTSLPFRTEEQLLTPLADSERPYVVGTMYGENVVMPIKRTFNCEICEDTGIAVEDASGQGGPDIGERCVCPAAVNIVNVVNSKDGVTPVIPGSNLNFSTAKD